MCDEEDNEIEVIRVFIKKYLNENENTEFYTIGWKDYVDGLAYGNFKKLTEIDGFTDAEMIDNFNECMEEYEDFKNGNTSKYLLSK